ncbi:MAG: AAA family ATPase [Actinomycetota bacterium]
MVTPFEGIVGHAGVIELLERELEGPAQSYLFVGPTNVGKATIARRFAAAVLCGDDGACFDRVLSGKHPDLVLVEPEGRASITVDQARHVVSQATRTPLESNRKVFLFEEGGTMNDEAANALLKTLEEPTPATVFVIVAETEDDLPDTVASRCRTVVLGRVSDGDVADGLIALGIAEEQAHEAARISGGRPGLALALATEPQVADYRRFWLSLPMQLGDQPGDAFRLADEAIVSTEPLLAALKERQQEEREALGDDVTRAFQDRQARELKRATSALHYTGLEILASFYRDVAAAQLGVPVRNTDVSVASLSSITPRRAVSGADRVLAAIDALATNQRPQLAFANLFADLATDA